MASKFRKAQSRATTQAAPSATPARSLPSGPAHRYHFQLFALDTMLDVTPGADRKAFLEAMEGHVLAVGSFVATFDSRKGVASVNRPAPDLEEKTKAVRQRARAPSRNTLARKPRD